MRFALYKKIFELERSIKMKKSIYFLMCFSMALLFLFGCSQNSGSDFSLISPSGSGEIDCLITNANVVDVIEGRVLSGYTLAIKDGNIADMYNTEESSYQADTIINANGMFIVPGFINTHVHIGSEGLQLKTWAASGVTTIRNLADTDDGLLLSKKDKFNEDVFNATMLSSTPIITKPGGYGRGYIDSPEEAIEMVRVQAAKGVDVIKISIEDILQGKTWPMLTFDEVKALTDEAHKQGLRVCAHVTKTAKLQIAIDAGVDEIAHMVVERVPNAMIKQMIKQDMMWIPTMELWKGVSEEYNINDYTIALDNLNRFYKKGGMVVFGTDFGGFTTPFDDKFPITEVRCLQEAGMSNQDIIKAGTCNAAYSCRILDTTGTIENGKLADMIICSENPMENMDALTEPLYVMHKGTIVLEPVN